MTDQGASKEVQQYATIASLKEITLSANKFLKKETKKGSRQKELKFKAKVVKHQLADESGFINFKAAEGVNLNNDTTYELTGLLSIVNYKLLLTVTSATQVQQIANLGNEQFSNADFDPLSGRSIVQIKDILTHRIGQSFFAKVKEVTLQEEKRVKAILADATGAIESDISVNSKRITSEVLKSLSKDKVYLFSDSVLFFNENNNLVNRFNYRSNIVEVNDRQIQQLSNNNLSAKQYSDATEKNALTDILKISEKKQKNNKQNKQSKNKGKPRRDHSQHQRTFPETTPVKINELQQWNNNQTFIGKIVSLNVETKQTKNQKNGKSEMHYLKGQVGDETGVIDFDMAEKTTVPRFQVGDIVKFSQAMNKGRNSQEDKVGGHYVEIKRFGRYTIINDVSINNVNQNNNLSTIALTPNPHPRKNESIKGKFIGVKVEDGEGDQKLYTYTVQNENGEQQSITIPQVISKYKEGDEVTIRKKNIRRNQVDRNRSTSQKRNNRSQQHNQDNRKNNNNQKGRSYSENNRNNRPRDNNNRENRSNQRVNNNQRSNGNSYPRNNERNSEGNRNNRNQSNQPRFNNNNNRPIRKTKIIDLEPGKRGQTVTGQVIEVENFSKQINQKTLHFVKGRIADETGNIRFDIKKPQFEINNGQVITLDSVNNKVDDNGFHYIDVLSNGGVHSSKKQFQSVNDQRGGDSDRSSIEYVKKTVPN